ncbi:MAG: DUF4105 domain-containing protein [Spirochaetaceae bacterium]|jgi:hypothetical protein|nr:DUF4105 domain-containing protein [Spirochaetaceae bacterium]
MKRMIPPLLPCLLLLLLLPPLAGEPAPAADRGDDLTLKIAVIGPGNALYLWWGHISLIIEDAATGQSRLYDYGVFSFDTDNFFVNFAFGRLYYLCIVSPAGRNMAGYIAENRDVTVYTLNLDSGHKEAVRRFVENNVRPENRVYLYHNFRDNCATRIRDLIDLGTDGQFRGAFEQEPGRYTFRQHVRRHTWFSPFFDWALNFWMGQNVDVPLTVWQEMFLPSEVGDRIRDFSYTAAGDAPRSLVSAVEVVNSAVGRPGVLAVPRKQWPRELLAGLVMAALFAAAGTGVFQRRHPACSRVFWGLGQSALGLFLGLTGSLLFFLTFFTDHDYTWNNTNVWFVNPLLLAAIPLGILAARQNRRAQVYLRRLWRYVFIAGLAAVTVKLLPGFYQQNQVTQALVLPIAAVLGFYKPHNEGHF